MALCGVLGFIPGALQTFHDVILRRLHVLESFFAAGTEEEEMILLAGIFVPQPVLRKVELGIGAETADLAAELQALQDTEKREN